MFWLQSKITSGIIIWTKSEVCIEHEVSQRNPKWHPWKHLQVWSISLFTIPLLDLRKEWYVLFFVFFHTDIYIMAFIVRGKQIKLHSTFPEFLWSWVPATVVCKLYPVLWISELFQDLNRSYFWKGIHWTTILALNATQKVSLLVAGSRKPAIRWF